MPIWIEHSTSQNTHSIHLFWKENLSNFSMVDFVWYLTVFSVDATKSPCTVTFTTFSPKMKSTFQMHSHYQNSELSNRLCHPFFILVFFQIENVKWSMRWWWSAWGFFYVIYINVLEFCKKLKINTKQTDEIDFIPTKKR